MSFSVYRQEPLQYDKIVLEKMRYAVSQTIGATAAANMEVRQWTEIISQQLVTELTTEVLTQKIASDKYTVYFDYKLPSSWWEHFKQDKMPKWFKRRYPVHYTTKHQRRTVKFTRYATYPMANVAMPKDRHTLELIGHKEVLRDSIEVDNPYEPSRP